MTHKKYLEELMTQIESTMEENLTRYHSHMKDCECLSENCDGSFCLYSTTTGRTTARDEAIYGAGQNHMGAFLIEHVIREWRDVEEKREYREEKKKRKKNGHN